MMRIWLSIFISVGVWSHVAHAEMPIATGAWYSVNLGSKCEAVDDKLTSDRWSPAKLLKSEPGCRITSQSNGYLVLDCSNTSLKNHYVFAREREVCLRFKTSAQPPPVDKSIAPENVKDWAVWHDGTCVPAVGEISRAKLLQAFPKCEVGPMGKVAPGVTIIDCTKSALGKKLAFGDTKEHCETIAKRPIL